MNTIGYICYVYFCLYQDCFYYFKHFPGCFIGQTAIAVQISKSKCNNDCDFVTLKCPPGQVIYNPDVIGDEDSGCDAYNKRLCKGMSPDLKASVLDCYWKNKCNIKISKQAMAMDFIGNQTDCFNRPIKSVWVHGWNCVNETGTAMLVISKRRIKQTSVYIHLSVIY